MYNVLHADAGAGAGVSVGVGVDADADADADASGFGSYLLLQVPPKVPNAKMRRATHATSEMQNAKCTFESWASMAVAATRPHGCHR